MATDDDADDDDDDDDDGDHDAGHDDDDVQNCFPQKCSKYTS